MPWKGGGIQLVPKLGILLIMNGANSFGTP
jgi:hypothetical protein